MIFVPGRSRTTVQIIEGRCLTIIRAQMPVSSLYMKLKTSSNPLAVTLDPIILIQMLLLNFNRPQPWTPTNHYAHINTRKTQLKSELCTVILKSFQWWNIWQEVGGSLEIHKLNLRQWRFFFKQLWFKRRLRKIVWCKDTGIAAWDILHLVAELHRSVFPLRKGERIRI